MVLMLLFFPELRRKGSVWYSDAAGARTAQALTETAPFVETKLSDSHRNQKRINHSQATGLVRISTLPCEPRCVFAHVWGH